MNKLRSFRLLKPTLSHWLSVAVWVALLIVIPIILRYCFHVHIGMNGFYVE